MSVRQDFIFPMILTALVLIIALFALTYSLPILCLRRFQNRNNRFTINVCLATALSCLSYSFTYTSYLFGESYKDFIRGWLWLGALQTILRHSLIFSFMMVSVHRCCSVVYYRNKFFRTRQWVVVCLASQWILAVIVCIPFIIDLKQVNFVCSLVLKDVSNLL